MEGPAAAQARQQQLPRVVLERQDKEMGEETAVQAPAARAEGEPLPPELTALSALELTGAMD